jgi:hypothetical protein
MMEITVRETAGGQLQKSSQTIDAGGKVHERRNAGSAMLPAFLFCAFCGWNVGDNEHSIRVMLLA